MESPVGPVNFGNGMAEVDTRLTILAGVEGKVLQTYDYIPMLQDAGMSLLSQQLYYVVEEYSPIMSRGGIAYLKYNYTEKEWREFVAANVCPSGAISTVSVRSTFVASNHFPSY